MLTIVPPLALRCGWAARQPTNTARALIAITSSKSWMSRVALGPSLWMPELFTRPRRPPAFCASSSIARWTLASSPTSQSTAIIDAGAPSGSRAPRVRQPTTKPRRASSCAIAAPMPRAAPVTAIAPPLAILEHRFALLHEGCHAFLGVVGRISQGREIGLDLEAVVQRQVVGALHRLAGEAQRRQAMARELARERDAGLDRV